MSARVRDSNGYITIKNNPVSRSGVFPYLGRSLPGDNNPDQIYWVYRPAEELEKVDTQESFELLPLIDDHEMLGPSSEGLTPAERKGVHGITGSGVDFENNILYADLKIFSESLADKIDEGKIDLSLGYRCRFDRESGVYAGQPYQFVQRDLKGNHIALVDEARCSVSILDEKECIIFDKLDIPTHKKETKDMALTPEQIAARMDAQDAALAKLTKALDDAEAEKKAAADKAAKDAAEAEAKEKADKEAAAKKAEDGDDDMEEEGAEDKGFKKAMDAIEKMSKLVGDLATKVETIGKDAPKAAMDAITKRDALVVKLKPFVGAFDASDMTVQDVAKYGVEKLKLPCEAGSEVATLNGFLAGAKSDAQDALPINTDTKKSTQLNAYKTGTAA